jgi:hypothetical protein
MERRRTRRERHGDCESVTALLVVDVPNPYSPRRLSCGESPFSRNGDDACDRAVWSFFERAERTFLCPHQRVEALPGDLRRVILFSRADRGVSDLGALEELGPGRNGHQRRDRHLGFLQLISDRLGELKLRTKDFEAL